MQLSWIEEDGMLLLPPSSPKGWPMYSSHDLKMSKGIDQDCVCQRWELHASGSFGTDAISQIVARVFLPKSNSNSFMATCSNYSLPQLSAYTLAGHRDDPTISPDTGAFLVIEKVSGALHLDVHKFEHDLAAREAEYLYIKTLMEKDVPPKRGFTEEDDGYYNRNKKEFVPNGNKVLSVNCSYCEFKHECWPGLRTFMYKGQNGPKPKFFTRVLKEPKAMEVKA